MLVLKNNFQGDNECKEKLKLTRRNENQHCMVVCLVGLGFFFWEGGRGKVS